jgi:peptidoglycan/LPS O-acetylase OafA/YrhL
LTDSDGKHSSSTIGGRTFVYLDGLRGLAAIAVVFCHFATRTDLPYLFAHGYLAVDFFFVLSGFVLAYAYRERLRQKKNSMKSLFVLRAIRLLPLVALGTFLAVIIETQRPGIADQALHWREMIAAFAMGTLLLPIWWTTTLEMILFPLNGPVWSLFFEAVANGIAAPMARQRNALVLALVSTLVLVSAITLIWVGVTLNTLDVGYSVNTFWYGFARVFFSFFVGVLIYVSGVKIRGVPGYISVCLFVLILAVPRLEGVNNGLFDLFAVLIVFPLIVTHISSLRPDGRFNDFFNLAGELSYPVYALHYPLVRAIGLVIRNIGIGMMTQVFLVLLSTVLIVVFSWFAYKYFDMPVRAYLTRRYLDRPKPAPISVGG